MHAHSGPRCRQIRGHARLGHVITPILLLIAFIALPAADALAQSRNWHAFVRVNRIKPRNEIADRTGRVTQAISQETAIYEATHTVGEGTGLDATFGVRVFRNLAVGFGMTTVSATGTSAFRSWVPDPVITNRFEQADSSRMFTHEQRAYHLQATWVIPAGRFVDISLFGGPTFFRLNEASSGTVMLPGIDSPAHNATAMVRGGNAGVDLTVRFGPYVGVGAVIGWSGAPASIDVPWRDEPQPITLGGMRTGGGLRLRF